VRRSSALINSDGRAIDTTSAELSAQPERTMNKDQIKGTAKDIAGKVQQKTGEVTGSASQQVKGVAKQVEGKIQKGVGDATEAARDSERKARQ